MDSVIVALDAEFRRRMSAKFEEFFDERITIITDPENGNDEVHKSDGSALDDEQIDFLSSYEFGWNDAMSTVADIAGWIDEDES